MKAIRGVALSTSIAACLAALFLSANIACAQATDSAPAKSADAKQAAEKSTAAAPPADRPYAPSVLPGNGLAQHDFLYAGEAKAQNIYIVRKGKIDWRYENATSKGEISDALMLSNGNILFAHQFGVSLISPDKKIFWNYDAPPQTEIHTAVPIGLEHVLFVQNGDPAKLVVMNIKTNQTEKEFNLPVGNPKSTHGQFRHARLTDSGTVLVAHMDSRKICEYDENGKQLKSIDVPGAWSVEKLKNGNTLFCSGRMAREIDPEGKTVWEFKPSDIPDYRVAQFQIATRLPNGNTLVNNWVNQWSEKIDPNTAPVQAWEVTPENKVVWALRSWQGDENLGPATTIQILDQPSAPENVHFGEIR